MNNTRVAIIVHTVLGVVCMYMVIMRVIISHQSSLKISKSGARFLASGSET